MIDIGSRKQLLIDDRFMADRRDVALVVNPPAKAGPVNVAASTAPSIVERAGVCYLYQGLNGATSVWTSPDGVDWTPRGPLKGVDDAAGLLGVLIHHEDNLSVRAKHYGRLGSRTCDRRTQFAALFR